MLAVLSAWLHGKNAQSDERHLPTFLPFFVHYLLLLSLQKYDHDAHQDSSPTLPTPVKPNEHSSTPQALLRLVGRAKRSLDQKGTVFVKLAVKGLCHPRLFDSRQDFSSLFPS